MAQDSTWAVSKREEALTSVVILFHALPPEEIVRYLRVEDPSMICTAIKLTIESLRGLNDRYLLLRGVQLLQALLLPGQYPTYSVSSV